MKGKSRDEQQNHRSLTNNSDRYQEDFDRAERASEASFLLEPEEGISPDPDRYNKSESQDDYNIKQMDS